MRIFPYSTFLCICALATAPVLLSKRSDTAFSQICSVQGRPTATLPLSEQPPERLAETPAYHASPPTQALPMTMDPAQFAGRANAFVVYSLAARIRTVLYQEPCFCHCNRLADHQSLLDCFTGTHGLVCYTCQREAIFCFEHHHKGWSAAKIRKALFAGRWKAINIDSYVESFQQKLHESERR